MHLASYLGCVLASVLLFLLPGPNVAIIVGSPKTLLFHGAFLPQFVDPAGDLRLQRLVLGATLTATAATLASGWAILADRLRAVLTLRPRLRDRVAGASRIATAAGLALAYERR